MKHKMFLMVAALVLLFLSAFNMKAQVGFNELDPNILWVADSTIGRIDGFVVHPNGNIFAYYGSKIYEIDGNTGKLVKELPVTIDAVELSSIDISSDGSKLAVSWNQIVIIDLQNYSTINFKRASLVKFVPNSSKIIYSGLGSQPGTTGSDSSIVILDLETQQRSYIKTEEMITKIAFSPDGRFFATGGSGKDVFGKSYVSLKLWDANTLKLIKELEKFPERSDNLRKIQFSPDSRSVSFWSNIGINIFDTQSLSEIKKYNKVTFGSDISGFTWIDNNNFVILSKLITICRLSDTFQKSIYEFPDWGYEIETDFINNRIITRTGYKYLGGYIISWDLNKVLSSAINEQISAEFQIQYQKGRIQIQNLLLISSEINIQILDINGKLIKNMNLPNTSGEISIPVILNSGAYIIHLKDGNKEYSSKFLVIE